LRARVTRSGLAKAFSDVALAAVYVAFAQAHLASFAGHPRLSVVALVPAETLLAVFALLRKQPRDVSTSAVAFVSTTLGGFLPMLLRPSAAAHDSVAGQVVQVVGAIYLVAGALSLNRSFGLLPANRGIRSGGAYRWVRHPLYSSYLVMHLGYVSSNLTLWNVLVLAIGLAAQIVRMDGEERLLSLDPEYASYKARTRWRLVPFVY
jgi:protein-S-isoprenylcysteine O-methyltransferase Ste14